MPGGNGQNGQQQADPNGTAGILGQDPLTAAYNAAMSLGSDSQAIDKAEQGVEHAKAKVESEEAKRDEADKQNEQALAQLEQEQAAMNKNLKDAKLEVKESSAENVVQERTAQGAIIDPMMAWQLVNTEEANKEERRKIEARKQELDLKVAGAKIENAAEMLSTNLKEAFAGYKDDQAGRSDAGGLLATAGGAVVGLLLSDTGIGQRIEDTAEDFTRKQTGNYENLQENVELGDGVEEKAIEGLEDSEQYARYVQASAGGEGQDPYLILTGEEYDPGAVPNKNVAATEVPQAANDEDDALKISEEGFTGLELNNLLAEHENAQLEQAGQPAPAEGGPEGGGPDVPDGPDIPEVPDL